MAMTFSFSLAGFYLFVGSSIYHDTEDVARIMSPIATASPSISSCVEFWYHMWGRDVETLNVYIKPESMALPSTPVTKLTGDQGNYWHRRTFTVPAGSGEYRVVFEGIPGVYIRDDIAIDDVRLFVEQSCPEFVTEPPQPTTMPPGRDNIDCDFEDDFCDYMQELDADYGDWERRQGLDGRDWPAFSRTGPTKDHTLDTRYVYPPPLAYTPVQITKAWHQSAGFPSQGAAERCIAAAPYACLSAVC
ncbi:MAM and LDL-receptor class A domain-containing protein 1-like [Lytechinus variegatus]|uniref:MAM and LDL-receptor class A domain-containing protein 1-like n=1 Tax=Lytechinus variegatus TaxID=7654 RepID=UPI001BB224DF|nr:MAM and LDL-receptor class A domain-containing protein 1-like [Lytechinus variegatus]